MMTLLARPTRATTISVAFKREDFRPWTIPIDLSRPVRRPFRADRRGRAREDARMPRHQEARP